MPFRLIRFSKMVTVTGKTQFSSIQPFEMTFLKFQTEEVIDTLSSHMNGNGTWFGVENTY